MGKMNKYANKIFYVGWTIYILCVLIRLTSWYSLAPENSFGIYVIQFIRYISYFLCLVAFVSRPIKLKYLIGFAIVEAFLIVVAISSGDRTMLLLSLVFIGSYKADSNKCIKIWLVVQLLFLFLIITFSLTGLAEDYIFNENLRPRHSLGFEWASISPTILFHCLLAYIYLKKEKSKILVLIAYAVISGALFLLTNSRMPFILTLIMILFTVYEKYKHNRFKLSRKIGHKFLRLPLGCMIFSLIIGYAYDRNNITWRSINLLLSNRLWLQHNALDYFGLSLFGNKIELVGYSVKTVLNGSAEGASYNYVDCSYIQVMLYYGVLFGVLIIAVYRAILQKYIECNDFFAVWIIVFILLNSLTEPRLINFAYNPFPILFCSDPRIINKPKEWYIRAQKGLTSNLNRKKI
ncbi:hypothetical protein [Blautia obeum]|jgi:hypothetical protein|nr:hypothetical protein [Blautia obeum]